LSSFYDGARAMTLPNAKATDGQEPAQPRRTLRDETTAQLRYALITGQIVPGRAITLRGLAGTLGTSPMPVREAIRSLAAENALEIRSNGRVVVPTMTESRFEDLVRARVLLEPEIAVLAATRLDKRAVDKLTAIDTALDDCLGNGDVDSYMRLNYDFHFAIYRAAEAPVLLPMIESLWLQFGPFMRTVYGRVGTINLVDQHKEAITAIARRDEAALRRAIENDILDGMRIIGMGLLQRRAPDHAAD